MIFLLHKMVRLESLVKKIKDAFLPLNHFATLEKVKFKSKSKGFERTIPKDLVL